MKYLLLLFSFFLVESVSAADFTVSSPTQVPSGYSLDASSGWYTASSSPNRYRVVGGGGTSASKGSVGGTGPNLSNDVNITNGQVSNTDLKAGNVTIETIPLYIAGMIQFLLSVAGTVAVVALIYHAVQMQINSGITGDSSGVDKAKKGMTGALIGFVIALLAWFIITRVVEILTNAT